MEHEKVDAQVSVKYLTMLVTVVLLLMMMLMMYRLLFSLYPY